MAIHIRNIPIKAYTTPEGEPTCCGLGRCIFYRTARFGTTECCAFDESIIKRRDGEEGEPGMGYTIVSDTCPVWCKKGKHA